MHFVVLPTIAAMLLLGALLGTLLHLSAAQADALALQRQEQLVAHALAQSAQRIANDQEASTLWDDAVLHLRDRPLDYEWLDANLGIWFHTFYRHDEVFILSSQGAAVYAMQAGVRTNPASFARVADQVLPLANQLRQQLRTGYLAPEGSNTQTVGVRDREIIDGRPAIISIKPVVSESGRVLQTAGSEYLHVSVRYLDGSFLEQMAQEFGMEEARYSRTRVAPASMRMTNAAGEEIGYIAWVSFAPGKTVEKQMLPALLAALILTGALLAWLLFRIRSSRIELEASRAQAQYLAFHDGLTGLPNRALFDNRLEHSLAQRYTGDLAVIILDLDRFKNVNDTLGHQAGDALIREFGARLAKLMREGDTVARFGGDEFALLTEDVAAANLNDLCERILSAVRLPFDILGNQAFVGVSVGVALCSGLTEKATEIVRRADIALYRAKGDGGNRYAIFAPSMDETVKLRSTIEEQLRVALALEKGLCVHFQPIISGGACQVVGFEALVRWEHPTRGLISPEHFIPVAEETGLIIELGEWVLAQASKTSARWPHLFMAVNLSPLQFRSKNLPERLAMIVKQNGADPRSIQLEVTEQVLLNDTNSVKETISQLRNAGFRIVLDDFGTGYSSLSYLRKFEVDKIKIDQSFIRNLEPNGESTPIVLAVLALGQAMGLTVTAEGVETQEQCNFLTAAGCGEMQGYLFSHAVPAEKIVSLLTTEFSFASIAA